jgi:hypothetical protein
MQKKLFIGLFTLLSLQSLAQDLKVDWSKDIHFDRKTTGYLEAIVGGNSKYVYVDMKPVVRDLSKTQRTLFVYDKITMQQIGKINLKTKVDFNDIEVTEDAVYVLSIDDQKGRETLFAETYTPTLKPLTSRKKVFVAKTSDRGFSKWINTIRAYSNAKANNYLYLISEKPAKKGQEITVDYNVIDNKLDIVHSGQVMLPIEATRTTTSNLSAFRVGDDGKILSKSVAKMTRAQRKKEEIKSSTFSILTVIDPKEKTLKSLPIKSSGKKITGFDYYTVKGQLFVVGFFMEDMGKRSEREKGVFTATLNTESGELENSKFIEIKEPDIDFGTLDLEKINHGKDGNITIIGGESQEYSVTFTNKNGTSTKYYTDKDNILVANLTSAGILNWSKLIKRKMTYSRWNVDDINSMDNENNAIITFADAFRKKSNLFGRFNMFNRKSNKDMRDNLSYAKIDKSSGTTKISTFNFNKSGISKKDRKMINATRIKEIDNLLYLDSYQPKVKTGLGVASCITAPVLGIGCLLYWITTKNGMLFKGGGQIGSLKMK